MHIWCNLCTFGAICAHLVQNLCTFGAKRCFGCNLLTVHCSLFTVVHCLERPIHCSLFTVLFLLNPKWYGLAGLTRLACLDWLDSIGREKYQPQSVTKSNHYSLLSTVWNDQLVSIFHTSSIPPPITHHPSNITHHPSPITHHHYPSPITHHPLPIAITHHPS